MKIKCFDKIAVGDTIVVALDIDGYFAYRSDLDHFGSREYNCFAFDGRIPLLKNYHSYYPTHLYSDFKVIKIIKNKRQ